ncbi:MAG: aminoacyl-tRNA hydrolase [Lachnospiraceae bacterium]|nr:aminoacyl-tRNA hydrolase [Lachnospiraceae bacterium]MBR1876480.1 aminoacyl-tRNA hydrolase [Lachnospiraceae bacterium]
MFGKLKKQNPDTVIIAGLGNPEAKYAGTRHNTGYDIIDELSRKYGIRLNREKFKGLYGKGRIEGKDVLLIKPLTYMNLSGDCISQVTSFYKTDISSGLIVIYDDIDLDAGRIRIRENGSAGGHNGMKDIIRKLDRQDFTRVRIGVGAKPADWDLVDWVLGHFADEDKEIMKKAHERAAEAVASILKDGVSKAMSRYNG